ncbi:MAG TPA: hypothetical protein VFY71_05185 [Planctomycetota bacterium]|nr:hypothetical protein [Planctomycetota bacterium]
MKARSLVALVLWLAAVSPSASAVQSFGTWEVVPSPNTGSPHNKLYGVAAITHDDVWAVGASGVFDVEGPDQVIQHWDGMKWSLVPTPVLAASSDLRAVSAVDAGDVWAVGGSAGTLIEHWNGASWSLASAPSPGSFAFLYGVSAQAGDDVWAVGQTSNGGLSKSLVEHWDGGSWTVIPSPNVANQHNQLNSVSAVPGVRGDAWAVGSAGPSALLMHWNGAQWSLFPTPPGSGSIPILNGVVALAADDVWAVGYTGGPSGTITLTLHWNGTAWSVVPSPNPGDTFNYLWGVGAAAPNDVWAAGDSNEDGDGKIVLLHWNGTAWLQVDGDNTGPSGLPFSLDAVAAVSGGDVWSVGTNSHSLAEHWNGAAWSIVSTPNAGLADNILKAVSGSGPGDVWQVGHTVFGLEHRTLTESWDGEAWAIVPSPNTGKRLNELDGVAAVSPTDAWAVGHATSGDVLDESTLILRWDGAEWAIVPSPNPGMSFNSLRAVASVAPDDVWAVGRTGPQFGPFKVLIEHWNGASWSVVPGANMPSTNNELHGVAVVAADDIWAAGYFGEFVFSPLIEHWDGSTWSIVPSPDPTQSSNILYAAAAAGPDDAWVVGLAKNLFTSVEGTLTERWDGDAWSVSFGVNGFFSTLYGVTAVAPDSAWEVGDLGGLALIGHWNGRTWQQVDSPAVEGRLWATSAIAPCDVWAVGQRSGAELGLLQTLSLHFTGSCGVWTDLGHALAGVAGEPVLTGTGTLTPGSSGAVTLTHAAPSAPGLLFVALQSAPVPFKGGTLVAFPPAVTLPLITSPLGNLVLPFASWPAGLSGVEFFIQAAIRDAAAVKDVALSNGLMADVP